VGADDHLNDAFLYGWWMCWHLRTSKANVPVPPTAYDVALQQRDPEGWKMRNERFEQMDRRQRQMQVAQRRWQAPQRLHGGPKVPGFR
jgi:hypothetical protein